MASHHKLHGVQSPPSSSRCFIPTHRALLELLWQTPTPLCPPQGSAPVGPSTGNSTVRSLTFSHLLVMGLLRCSSDRARNSCTWLHHLSLPQTTGHRHWAAHCCACHLSGTQVHSLVSRELHMLELSPYSETKEWRRGRGTGAS